MVIKARLNVLGEGWVVSCMLLLYSKWGRSRGSLYACDGLLVRELLATRERDRRHLLKVKDKWWCCAVKEKWGSVGTKITGDINKTEGVGWRVSCFFGFYVTNTTRFGGVRKVKVRSVHVSVMLRLLLVIWGTGDKQDKGNLVKGDSHGRVPVVTNMILKWWG